MALDALGNEIVIGNWYGYSRNDGGFSHTTIGRAMKITDPKQYTPSKVRLGDCQVKRFLYGEPTDHRSGDKPSDISIASYMVFPVPPME